MPFKDLDLSLFGAVKELPIGGKVYQFPGAISGRTGLILHRMAALTEQVQKAQAAGEDVELDADIFADMPEAEHDDVRAELLGEAQYELIDDGVSAEVIDHVLATLTVWHQYGEEIAEKVWADVPGAAPAPKAPQDRRPKATASGTRTASRAGTTRRTTKPAASTGRRSSSTGA